jgi:hypothetical protein
LKELLSLPLQDKSAGLYTCLGEHLSAAEEGRLSDLVLRSVAVVFDPVVEKSFISLRVSEGSRSKKASGGGTAGLASTPK